MSKPFQTVYVCTKCGAQFPKWLGRCLECGGWGTLEEVQSSKFKVQSEKIKAGEIIDFNKIEGKDVARIKTGVGEFDRVLGGGLVPGSLVLLGGEPGIGKSTLVLEVASQITRKPILYISGEESAQQLKIRLDRLALASQGLQFLGETNIETICATLDQTRPQLAIVDSIQTMASGDLPSEAGSINQVRVSCVKLLQVAKKNHLPLLITGHVTKEGFVAGPKTLEHLVDTVIYLEGERYGHFRILRTVKNRFGPTSEVGVFEMGEKGLKEVKNPSEAFLQGRREAQLGSIVTAVVEGSRPFLVEIQALVSPTVFGYPRRTTSGFDFNRLQLLLAVLTRRSHLALGSQDVYVNVVGGFRIEEPASDLACALAIASAFKNRPIDEKTVAFGEIGLGGEVRPVSQIEKRLKEAEKLGFERILGPVSLEPRGFSPKLKILKVRDLNEAIGLTGLS